MWTTLLVPPLLLHHCSQGWKAALWEILNNFFFVCWYWRIGTANCVFFFFCHCLNVAYLNAIIIQGLPYSWLVWRLWYLDGETWLGMCIVHVTLGFQVRCLLSSSSQFSELYKILSQVDLFCSRWAWSKERGMKQKWMRKRKYCLNFLRWEQVDWEEVAGWKLQIPFKFPLWKSCPAPLLRPQTVIKG